MKTNSEILKELRQSAKDSGLTFKKVNYSINGAQAYGLFIRNTSQQTSRAAPLCWWITEHVYSDFISEF